MQTYIYNPLIISIATHTSHSLLAEARQGALCGGAVWGLRGGRRGAVHAGSCQGGAGVLVAVGLFRLGSLR